MKAPFDRIPLPADPAELGQVLEAAFAGRATIGLPELAALIPMHRETIARHIAAGNLVGRLKGLGRTRRHRVFTISDVMRFIQTITDGAPAPTSPPTRSVGFRVLSGPPMRITMPKKRRRS